MEIIICCEVFEDGQHIRIWTVRDGVQFVSVVRTHLGRRFIDSVCKKHGVKDWSYYQPIVINAKRGAA